MKRPMVCNDCYGVGKPRRVTPGSFFVELALWCLFLLPGMIYSVWRLASRKDVCRACGSQRLIVDSVTLPYHIQSKRWMVDR